MHSCYVPVGASATDTFWNNDTAPRLEAGNAALLLDLDANRLAGCLCRWVELFGPLSTDEARFSAT